MKTQTTQRRRRGLGVAATAVLLCAVAGCAALSQAVTPTAGGDANTDARTASPDLLTDRSERDADVSPAQRLAQGDNATADIASEAAAGQTDQKGIFNTSLAVIGGSSAAGISGVACIALWLRWARLTGRHRTDAQTQRIRMLVDLLRAAIRGGSGGDA